MVQIELDKRNSLFVEEYQDVKRLLKKYNPIVKEVSETLRKNEKLDGEECFKQIVLVDKFVKELDELNLNLKSTIELRRRIQSLNFFHMGYLEECELNSFQRALIILKEGNLRKTLIKFE